MRRSSLVSCGSVALLLVCLLHVAPTQSLAQSQKRVPNPASQATTATPPAATPPATPASGVRVHHKMIPRDPLTHVLPVGASTAATPTAARAGSAISGHAATTTSEEPVNVVAPADAANAETQPTAPAADEAKETAGTLQKEVDPATVASSPAAADPAGAAADPPAGASSKPRSPIGEAEEGVCPRACSGHGQCLTLQKGRPSICVCQAGWESNDCAVPTASNTSSLPSMWSLVFLVIGVVACERAYKLYTKMCVHGAGRSTEGFSQVGMTDVAEEREALADQRMNERL